MTTMKQLGIYMDHASAHLLSNINNEITFHKIESKFTHQVKADSLSKGENLMHDKEQQQQGQYYKAIADQIKNYTEVLIFGPTDAKLELKNSLTEDKHFLNINIEIETTDKLDQKQQELFIRNHYAIKSK